jgi:tetratricopeptide (TPR) repeat protein
MRARGLFSRVVVGLVAGTVLASAAAALDLKPDEVQTRYRRVLTLLAQGERDQAMSALFDLETQAVPDSSGSMELEKFWRLKLSVIRELLNSGQTDQLIPIIVLHHDAFDMYRHKGKPLLASHSRTMAAELAEILADRSDDPQVDQFCSWVLTSFGIYYQETRSLASSAEFFGRALKIEPGNRAALLGLAAAHEKYGEYDQAVPYLRTAVSLDANDHEARLRLALCLRRSGTTDEAVAGLKSLLGPDTVEWVRSIAYQELARIYREDGQPDAAEATLRQAIEQLPKEQQPRLELAAYLELDRRPKEAKSVLDGLEPREDGPGSPRYIYDQWPTSGIEQARNAMREMMQSRLYLLAAALHTGTSTGVGS